MSWLSDRPVRDEVGAVDRVCCVVCLMLKGKPCAGVESGYVHEARVTSLVLDRVGWRAQGSAGW
ncbi:MAG TPA: hypothetical protein VK807_23390 [Gemmatimonadaceae bacterium]|nr:hypothetical protein [Gemmatimonadaceae bacterium]